MKTLTLSGRLLSVLLLGILLTCTINAQTNPMPKPTPISVSNNLADCTLTDPVQLRIYYEYGAFYVSAGGGVDKAPCLFQEQENIDSFLKGKLDCFTDFGNGKFCLQKK